MTTGKAIVWGGTIVGVAAFFYGLVHLLMLRFEAGDIYPPYSSLRTDPLGTKALHESLEELERVRARRNFTSLDKLEDESAALLYLGTGTRRTCLLYEGETLDHLAEFAAKGGRLVITVSAGADPEIAQRSMLLRLLHREWDVALLGTKFNFHVEMDMEVEPGERADLTGERCDETLGGEQRIPWRSPLYFAHAAEEWRTVYQRDGKPVVIERQWEKGTVVACAGSYFLSNEGLRNEPCPKAAAWLIGRREVIFEETHLGAVQKTGVATLARQYNLAGALVALLVVAGLFVWKNAVGFLPRDQARVERLAGRGVAGRGSAAGLLNILRQSIPPRDVLSVCLGQWVRDASPDRPGRKDLRKRVEAVISAERGRPARKRDLAAAYRRICRIVSQRD